VSEDVQADCHDETPNRHEPIGAWPRDSTLEAAGLGTTTLLHDDRIVRVMIVRNEIPPAVVEWVER
jgi:hypothetical protein